MENQKLEPRLFYKSYTGFVNMVNRLRPNPGNKPPDDAEAFFGEIYLEQIREWLKKSFGEQRQLRILDGGIGEGRIAHPLAVEGHLLTGIDKHRPSLDVSESKFLHSGTDVTLILGDFYTELQRLGEGTFDVVLCLETLYTCPDYRRIVSELVRVLKGGGLFIASFRSRYYFLATLLRKKNYKEALFVSRHSEGILRVAKLPTYYNWQTIGEIVQMFEQNKLALQSTVPIGVFCGMEPDGIAGICSLDLSEDVDFEALRVIEATVMKEIEGAGRYIFAVGKKRSE